MKDGKGKSSKSSAKKSVKVTQARPETHPSTPDAPKAPKRKASKGYDPTKDGPLHKDHPLVNDLNALSHRFYEHAVFYLDDGAFIVHRILSVVGRAIWKNQGEDLSREKGIYSAARSLLRSYDDPMPDEDAQGRALGFKSLAGRFRIFSDMLRFLIRGHEIAHERAAAHAAKVAAEKRTDEIVAALKSQGFTADNVAQIPEAIRTELVELAVTKTRAEQTLKQEKTKYDSFAHVMARFRMYPMGAIPMDHWRTPAKFEDNKQVVWSYLITYFPQIPSIRDARRDSGCDAKLGARVEAYLRTHDERRAKKMAEFQKLGIEYTVDENAKDLAYYVLSHECKFSGMKETRISKLFGFLNEHKKKDR